VTHRQVRTVDLQIETTMASYSNRMADKQALAIARMGPV
jgi:hypothetical protein